MKLFVTASAEVRGKRRYDELVGRGDTITLDDVIEDVRARDARDMERVEAPLKPAEDAHVLDTSALSISDAVAEAIAAITQKLS